MLVRPVDDKSSDTLVVVSDEGFWTGSSTLPHLHHQLIAKTPRSMSAASSCPAVDRDLAGPHEDDAGDPRIVRVVGVAANELAVLVDADRAPDVLAVDRRLDPLA